MLAVTKAWAGSAFGKHVGLTGQRGPAARLPFDQRAQGRRWRIGCHRRARSGWIPRSGTPATRVRGGWRPPGSPVVLLSGHRRSQFPGLVANSVRRPRHRARPEILRRPVRCGTAGLAITAASRTAARSGKRVCRRTAGRDRDHRLERLRNAGIRAAEVPKVGSQCACPAHRGDLPRKRRIAAFPAGRQVFEFEVEVVDRPQVRRGHRELNVSLESWVSARRTTS